MHSTLSAAALFLVVDQVRARRGQSALSDQAPMPGGGLVAALFFAAAIALAGMPPLSGFLGKLMVLDAIRAQGWWVWGWGFVLGTSLLAVVGFSRAGSTLFWKPYRCRRAARRRGPQRRGAVHLGGWGRRCWAVLLALIVALTVLAGPMTRYAQATAAQLYTPSVYIHAVLGTPEDRAARAAAEMALADRVHGADHGAPMHSAMPEGDH